MENRLAGAADFHVVLFSGGRGSGALVELIGADERLALTVAINGYDDGASTGEVRRFLGDALGPSDFRKNASRFARLRQTCAPALVDLLDYRLPDPSTAASLSAVAEAIDRGEAIGKIEVSAIDAAARSSIVQRLRGFEEEYQKGARSIRFDDASLGNFVFAGAFLKARRQFNDAVDDYCALLGLPIGLIEDVTDGVNAFLVAEDDDGRILGSEEEIVDGTKRNRIREIFLLDSRLSDDDIQALSRCAPDERRRRLEARIVRPRMNPRLAPALERANMIIYAPGTQHSSLFPSYLTTGLGEAIAANLSAMKLLVTNIQEDAEITGRSAVDLIDKAVFYLRDKGRLSVPTPCVITHFLVNDPAKTGADKPYVPLGRLESLEDPRLIRVGNYEAGSSGRHDAAKVLAPYIEGFVARERAVPRVAIVMIETRSPNKVTQTLLEMVRGGIRELRFDLTVFHTAESDIDAFLCDRLGFPVKRIAASDAAGADRELRSALAAGQFEYVVLFDSSGMYNGEDISGLAAHLTLGRLDAVWGSRRLSLRDIQESYRLRYRDNALQGALSAMGSHVLSLQFLALFGRYVADTLSGARAVRTADMLAVRCALTDNLVNQHLLSGLLRRRAEILEIPVQFFAISPDQVRRTTVADGVRSIGIAVSHRFRRPSST